MRQVMKPGGLHPAGSTREGFPHVTNGQRVLVVDGLAETEEVLKAVLEPLGLKVNRIRTHSLQDSADSNSPHVVILHEDRQTNSADSRESWPDVPRVIIGSISTPPAPGNSQNSREEYLAQPFQYGDLIRKVEDLLARS